MLPSGLRLLMSADTVGGVWTYAVDLARSLTGEGAEVLLATMGEPLTPSQWEEVDAIAGLRVEESRYRLEWMDSPWDDVHAAGHWLLGLQRRFGADLVHLNNYAHADLPWTVPVLVVGHSCVYSWWEAVHGCAPPQRYRRYFETVRRGLRAADRVAAPSRAMGAALARHYGTLPHLEVIHNGRNPAAFRAGRKRHTALAVGRLWDAAKNIAMAADVAGDTPWPLYVAGERRHPAGGEVDFGGVEFLGKLAPNQLRRHYSEASLYVFPARYEPFGLSVLEAALSGCGLLLGDIPSLRELWDGAAVFVPPDDREAIRTALLRLTGDGAARSRLMTAARKRARRYSLEACAARYAELYGELLATQRATRPVSGPAPRRVGLN